MIARKRSAWFATQGFINAHQAALSGDFDQPLPFIGVTAWPNPIPKDVQALYPHARPIIVSDDQISVIQLVRAGLGMSRFTWFIARSNPDLVQIPRLPIRPYAPIWALTHPDQRKNAMIRGFISFIGRRFAERSDIYFGPT